jgi:chitinase
MAYDYAGSWDSTSGHQSNLYPSRSNPSSTPLATCSVVNYYRERGVPGSKIVVGMPLYGRAFASTDGPGMKFSGTGEGSWEQGVWDFKCLPQPGAREMYCDEACASWTYDPDKRLMISYDTDEVAKRKASFIKAEGLGGAMWWESSGDKKGDGSLIHHVSFPVRTISMFLIGLHRLPIASKTSTVVITRYHILIPSTKIYEQDSQMNKGKQAGKSNLSPSTSFG